MKGANHYVTLGVAPDATGGEIRRAYLEKVREHPPERDPEGFKRVREAYEHLRSPRKRAELALLDLREGPVEFDLDRLRDEPSPPFPPQYLDHLLAILLADLDAAVDSQVLRARQDADLGHTGVPAGAEGA
ncbi:MAG: DnaJ domain-containing protein [Dehalococcoidia bacterium]|nr:DnaJ domain-containing protein [Dehalococcoidia bacterium]